MRVASARAARCTACGCSGRTQVLPTRASRALRLVVSVCRSLARATYVAAMVRSRRRCALRGRCLCSAGDAAGRTACRRSQRCTHTQAPLRKLRRALRESIHRHWLRKPSRFPLRPRQRRFRSGRAVGRRLPGEPGVVFRWTVDRRALVGSVGADPRATQRRMRRDCAFSLAAVEPAGRGPIVRRTRR
jgi:hypothetical protein